MTQQSANPFVTLDDLSPAVPDSDVNLNKLEAASARAREAVLAASATLQHQEAEDFAQLSAEAEASKNNWASSPDSFLNMGAHVVKGVARGVDKVAALVPTAMASYQLAQVPTEATEIYSRYLKEAKLKERNTAIDAELNAGGLTEEQANNLRNEANLKFGDTPVTLEEENYLYNTKGIDGESYWDSLNKGNALLKTAKEVGTHFSESDALRGIVNTEEIDLLTEDLNGAVQQALPQLSAAKSAIDDGDIIEGVKLGAAPMADLIYEGVTALANHPSATLGYALENAPQIALAFFGKKGKALLGTTNVAFGVDVYVDAMNNLINEEGRLPSREEHQDMAKNTMLWIASESIGDLAIIKAIAPKAFKSGAAKAAIEAANETATVAAETSKGFLRTVAGAAVKGTTTLAKPVVGVAGTGIAEGTTELTQTVLEGKIKNEDVSPEELYSSFVIGAGAGATMTAGGKVIASPLTVANKVRQGILESKVRQEKEKVYAARFDNAVETGDFSNITDPEVEGFDSLKLADTYQKRNAQEGIEEEEAVENSNAVFDLYINETEKLTVLREKLDTLPNPSKEHDAAQAEMLTVQKRVKEIHNVYKNIEAAFEEEPIAASVDTLNSEEATEEEVATAKERVFGSVILGPKGSKEELAELAENKRGHLTAEEVEIITYALHVQQAKEDASSMQDVNKDVFFGFDGTPATKKDPGKPPVLGIPQHSDRIRSAINKGDDTQIRRAFAAYAKFIKSQEDKRRLFAEVYTTAKNKETFSPDLIERMQNRGLYLKDGEFNLNLIRNVENEIDALRSSYAGLQLEDKRNRGAAAKSKKAKATKTKKTPDVEVQEEVVLAEAPVEAVETPVVEEKVVTPEPVKKPGIKLVDTFMKSIDGATDVQLPKQLAAQKLALKKLTIAERDSSKGDVIKAKIAYIKNAMAEKEEEYGPDDVPWDTEEKAKPAKEVEKEKPKEEKAVELAEPSKEAKDSKPKPAKKVKEESESKTTPAQSKKAVKTIKSNFDKVIENASKIEGIATGEFLSENSDVAILMDLLGITATEGKYKKTPSEASIAASQKEVFGIYEKVASGAISIEEAKPLLVKELSWMRSTDQAGDSTARQDRAKRGAARYGEGNPDAHLVLQLVEELGEMAAESTVSENPSKPLEVLKRALKILRFGASTVIKQEGIYKGQTNYEALTSALTTKEVEPVIDVKLENNTSEESLGARFLKGLKKNRTYEEFVAYMETLTDAQKKTRKADPKYYYEISKNWVKDHFKAKRVKEGSVFHTTLDVFNAISDATGTKIDPNSEVLVNKLGDNIKQEYIDYLQGLLDFHLEVKESFNSLIKDPNKDFMSEYVLQQLMIETVDADGKSAYTMDPNILASMSTSLYNWVATSGPRTDFNTEDDIRSILGIESGAYLDRPNAHKLLRYAGVPSQNIFKDLGKDIYSSIGITPKASARVNMESNLQIALGETGLMILTDMGITKQTNVDRVALRVLVDRATNGESFDQRVNELKYPTDKDRVGSTEYISFFRLAKNAPVKGKKKSGVRQDTGYKSVHTTIAIATDKSAPDLAKKLFDKERSTLFPSLEKPTIDSIDKVMKGTEQVVVDELREVVLKQESIPHALKVDNLDMFDLLGHSNKLIVAGNKGDPANYYVDRREGIESINENASRAIDHLTDLRKYLTEQGDSGANSPFYYAQSVWSMTRIGNKSSMNPQGDKTIRHAVKQQSWDAEVDLNDATTMRMFQLGLALNFDMKIEKATESLEKLNSKVAPKQGAKDERILYHPDMQKALQAIESALINKPSSEADVKAYQEAVMGGLNVVGPTMAALDSMVNAARWQAAKNAGRPTFTSDIILEVDGKTNGPIIAAFQLAANMGNIFAETVLRGGISYKEDGSDAAAPELQDVYQRLTTIWYKGISTASLLWSKEEKAAMKGIEEVLGSAIDKDGKVTKDGRSLAKQPVTQFIYGSGPAALKNNLLSAVMEGIFDKLENAANIGKKDIKAGRVEYAKVIKSIAALTQDKTLLKNTDTKEVTPADMLKFRVNAEQFSALAEFVETKYGSELVKAIEKEFATFKENSKIANKAMGMLVSLYNEQFRFRKEQLIAQMRKEYGAKYASTFEITLAQEKQIKKDMEKSFPALPSYLSEGTEQEIEGGIAIAKTKLSPDYSEAFKVRTQFKRAVKNTVTRVDGVDRVDRGGVKSMGGYGYSYKMENPGVRAMVLMIHHLDASIMQRVLAKLDVLNVHDAFISGVLGTTEAHELINEAFAEVMTNYDLLTVASERTKEANKQFKEFILSAKKSGEMSEVDFKKMYGMHKKAEEIFDELEKTSEEVYSAKRQKIDGIQVWNQYYMENGGYRTPHKKGNAAPEPLKSTPLDAEEFMGSFSEDHIKVDAMSSVEVFNSMENKGTVQATPEHRGQLLNVLNTIVNAQLTDFTLKVKEMSGVQSIGVTTLDSVYVGHGVDAKLPEGSRLVSAGLRMSSQEVFVHEMVHNVISKYLDVHGESQVNIQRLWRLARNKLVPADFITDPTLQPGDAAYAEQLEEAQVRYDHIFRPSASIDPKTGLPVAGDASSAHLHEFVTFGLTNQRMRELLSSDRMNNTSVKEAWLGGTSLLEKLKMAFEAILELVSDRLIGLKNIGNDARLDALVKDMMGIELRHKNGVLSTISAANDVTTEAVGKILGTVVKPLNTWAKSQKMKDQKTGLMAIGATMVRVAEMNMPEATRKMFNDMRDATQRGKYGLAQELLTELQGMTKDNVKMHELNRLANKMVDQLRMHVATTVKNVVRDSFDNTDGPMDDHTKASVTKTVLMTDLVSLVDTHSVDQMAELMENDSYLNAEITRLINELQVSKHHDFYRRSARSLGHLMVTGQAIEKVTNRNAHNIARLAATHLAMQKDTIQDTEALSGVEKTIDSLATLYALKFSAKSHKKAVVALIKKEQARTDSNERSNGFVTVLAQHKALKEDAMEHLFEGNPESYVKGHVFEITNDRVAIKVRGISEEAALRKEGFKRTGKRLARDSSDPTSEDLYVYVNRDGAMGALTGGTLSHTNRKPSGTNSLQIQQNLGNTNAAVAAMLDSAVLRNKKLREAKQMFKPGEAKITAGENIMVPVIGKDLNASGYRYLMREHVKDSVLEKHNNFDAVMGGMAGNNIDKINSKIINDKVVVALHEQFKEDFADKAEIYVNVGPNSLDKALREKYLMLPEDTKRAINKEWGSNGMMVRKDLVSLVFGQRRASVIDMYRKNEEDRNAFERLAVKATAKLLDGNFPSYLHKVEDVLKEIVKEGKDIIVTKLGTVTVANFTSNSLLLKMLGVPTKDIIKWQWEATTGIVKYQKDKTELDSLRLELNTDRQGITGGGNVTETSMRKKESRIAELEHDLKKNPVHELVEAGVLQSIIEDVEGDDDLFSYKTSMEEKLSPFTEKVPASVQTVAKNIYMSHDTKIYKVMNNAVRMSDFVARYALHKHYTSRPNNPLSSRDSINKVVDIFINYDIPTNKILQYMNDLGLVWFTKYAIRVQKVIWETMRDNPSATIATLIFSSLIGDAPVIMDGTLLINKGLLDPIGSPFSGVSSAGDILSVNVLTEAVS